MRAAMLRCPGCGVSKGDLQQHFAKKPDCDPANRLPLQEAPVTFENSETSAFSGENQNVFEKFFTRKVMLDYNEMRYKKFVDTTSCDMVHGAAVGWFDIITKEMIKQIGRCNSVGAAVATAKDVCLTAKRALEKLQTDDNREAYNKKVLMVPYVAPEPYDKDAPEQFRKKAAKLSLVKLLTRLMQHDQYFRKTTLATSKDYMTGKYYKVQSQTLADVTDADKVRASDAMRKATAEEADDVRTIWQFHNDGVTYVNPIGTKKGEHKYEITSAACCNLPLRRRLSFEYILLLSVVQSKLAKAKGGMLWVLCGCDADGVQVVDDATAADMRALDAGVWIKIPDDENPDGEDIWIRLKGYFGVFSADWLAAQALGFTPESTQAQHPCGQCMWTSLVARTRKRPAATAPASVPLRTHSALAATAAMLKATRTAGGTAEALEHAMRDAGISKLHAALSPELIPDCDSVLDIPPDIMHLFGCGISRSEPAWALEILFDPKSNLAVDDAWDKLRTNISRLHLPTGKRISKLYPQTKGKKWNEMHLDLNASQTNLFMMHSVTLVEPLLTAAGRAHTIWLSWLAHRSLLAKCLQHSFVRSDAARLQTLIEEYITAFDSVPNYAGLERPKHHFLTHLVAALLRFGPFRGFWCMPWDAFLQLIKRIISCSNYINPAYFIVNFWSMMTGLRIVNGGPRIDFEDQLVASSTVSYDLQHAARSSRLFQACLLRQDTSLVYAFRHIRMFTRGSVEVRAGTWILASANGMSVIGRIDECMELMVPGMSLLRMFMSEVRHVSFEDPTRGAVITVPRAAPTSEMYACVEQMSLLEVYCDEQDAFVLTFNYIY